MYLTSRYTHVVDFKPFPIKSKTVNHLFDTHEVISVCFFLNHHCVHFRSNIIFLTCFYLLECFIASQRECHLIPHTSSQQIRNGFLQVQKELSVSMAFIFNSRSSFLITFSEHCTGKIHKCSILKALLECKDNQI